MKTSKEKRNLLGFAPAAIAPFFLFNPEFAVVDVLPDVIAYLLLTRSLTRLRDISPFLEEAYDKFRKMILVSAVKFVSIYWLYGLLQAELSTWILVFSFSFAVVELILLIPAWRALFGGLAYLCETSGGTAALVRCDRIRRATVSFLLLKAVFTVLPEVSSLSDPLYGKTNVDWADFTGLFRAAGMLVVLILGIVWAIRVSRYFAAVRADNEFFAAAAAKYDREVTQKVGRGIRRGIRTSLSVLAAAALLSADLVAACSFGSFVTVEVPVNILPDVICGITLIVAFCLFKPFFGRWKLGAVLSAVYTLLSGAAWFVSFRYHYQYTDTQMRINTHAYEAFWKMYALNSLCNLLFLGCMLLALVAVAAIIRDHCGYIPASLDEKYREDKLAEIRRELMARLNVCAVFAFLVTAVSLAYDYVLTVPDLFIAELWWLICIAASAALFFSVLSLASAVNEEAESRYMLE